MRSLFPLLLVAALLAPVFTGCASSDDGLEMEHSRGVVVDHSPYDVWVAARSVLSRVGRGGAQIDEDARIIGAEVEGTPVRVQVEPYGTTGHKAILRVIADREDDMVPEQVLNWIVAQLPAR